MTLRLRPLLAAAVLAAACGDSVGPIVEITAIRRR